MKNIFLVATILSLVVAINPNSLQAQTITGAWKGKINATRVELKLIRSGDSLAGTSYYYESKNNFRRYSVKGYFDPLTNEVIWWDDRLVADKTSGVFSRSAGADALLATADFNCPGEDKMMLDGTTSLRDDKETVKGSLHLEKTQTSSFPDEWDFVIENYTIGANDPYIIDSIAQLPFAQAPIPGVVTVTRPSETRIASAPKPDHGIEKRLTVQTVQTVEQKFTSRKKVLATVIPVTGDSIELRFYDNAEIDGDSISLFMNDHLIFKHIRLSDQPYTLKFASATLEKDNELVMVAENLGSIPPNTSLMVAIVGDKRYEARLQSSENSSALIRIIRQGEK